MKTLGIGLLIGASLASGVGSTLGSVSSRLSQLQSKVDRLRLGESLRKSFRVGLSGVSALGAGVSGTLHRIKASVFSLQGALAGLGAGMVGKAFLEATIGGAASLQQYQTSVEHWMGGDKKKSESYFRDLKRFANLTPFSDQEVYGAAGRALNVAGGGDAQGAMRLMKLSGDMAALTPGKSISDALEALADAKMGEFERLKEFGFKFNKKDLEKLGVGGLIGQIEKAFGGGAAKLSKTLSGQWSTLKGNMGSFFAAAGGQGGRALAGGLERINSWWEKNQGRISRWAEALGNVLGKGIDLLLAKLERFGAWLDKNIIGNKAFQDLDFAHQIDFLWKAAEPSVVGIGKQIGLALGKGVALGLKGSFGMALEGVKEGDWSKALTGGLLGGGILKMTGFGDLLGGAWGMGKKMLGRGAPPVVDAPVSGEVPGGMGKMASLGKGAWTGAMTALGKVQDVAAVGMHKLTGAVGRASTAFLAGAKSAWAFSMGLAGKMIGSLKVFGMTLWTKVIPAVWSFTVALLTNPITWIVLGVVALGAALVLLALNWDKVKAAALRCWESIKGGAAAVRDWIVAKISGALLWVRSQWNGLCVWFTQLPAQVGAALAGIGEAIMTPFKAAFAWIGEKIDWLSSKWEGLKSAFSGGGAPAPAGPAGGPSGSGASLPLPGHATGGIFDRPHVAAFAEGGRSEAAIPLEDHRPRALSIFAETGRRLGVTPGGPTSAPAGGRGNITIHAPITIHAAPGQDPQTIAQEVLRRFQRMMAASGRREYGDASFVG